MTTKPKKKFLKKLRHRYRIVIRDESTLEEKFSLKLTRINVIILLSSIIVATIVVVFSLIAFTPLKEYVPGYGDFDTRKEFRTLNVKTDSLEDIVRQQELYYDNLQKILTGDVSGYTRDKYKRSDSLESKKKTAYGHRSPEDSLLRLEFEQEETYNLMFTENVVEDQLLKNIMFFPPVRGVVTSKFDVANNHPAVDIASSANVGIKAVLDGTVIYSDWNINNGFVIILQHKNNLVSAYKHNSVLLKKVGNFVRAGEVIAIIGETGELSHGAHLHFELWYDGSPLDPEKYVAF